MLGIESKPAVLTTDSNSSSTTPSLSDAAKMPAFTSSPNNSSLITCLVDSLEILMLKKSAMETKSFYDNDYTLPKWEVV